MDAIKNLKNFDELANRLIENGVEKARQEAEAIIQDAQEKSSRIIEDAQKQREKILDQTHREQEKLKKATQREIQLSGKRAIASLKDQLVHLMRASLLDSPLHASMDKETFVQEILLEFIQKWEPNKVSSVSISGKQSEILQRQLIDTLGDRYEIRFLGTDHVAETSVIIKTEHGYEIQISEDSLKSFLRPFFTEALYHLLFTHEE